MEKTLNLYVDRNYIVGSVSIDRESHAITPPNNEDRFWLYFYEDTTNDAVYYGHEFQEHFRNKENHYYGDIFPLITDNANTFSSMGGHKLEMSKIFKFSEIFKHIKEAGEFNEKGIDTYVSFSTDISFLAQKVFLDILKEENFSVKQNTARIDQLTLEFAKRKNQLEPSGYYLILNACNDNLLYSMYQWSDNIFIRKGEDKIKGMGVDFRERSLIEYIVRTINNREHFLSNDSEIEEEYKRLEQFSGEWLKKLEVAKPNIPITISNISFAKTPLNLCSVSILKRAIDNSTQTIIQEIIRYIEQFVKNNGVNYDQINGFFLLGDTFSNSEFKKTIKTIFSIEDNNLITFKQKELPNIVGVYSELDCNQFNDAKNKLANDAKTEFKRLQLIKEEQKRKEENIRLEKEKVQKNKEVHESENKYNEAMSQVYDYEKTKQYVQMRDWANIALRHKADDIIAKNKLDDSVRLIAEEEATAKQYNKFIQKAQKSYENGKWEKAVSLSEAALNVRPSSEEAKRINDQSKTQIQKDKDIERYLIRADMFIAQKFYTEASDELKKVQSLDSKNKELISRNTQIEKAITEQKQQINDSEKLIERKISENNFDAATEICNKMIIEDVSNQQLWQQKILMIKSNKDKFEKNIKEWNDLNRKIHSALFNENWSDVVKYCKEALQIKGDDSLKKDLKLAEEKTLKQKIQQKKEESI